MKSTQGAGKGKRVMGGKPHGEGGAAEGDAAGLPPGAAPSGRIPVPRHMVRLPLEVSTHLECKWRDGKFYPARIIERRKVDGTADEYEYYVHYRKFNRRMDEWVALENFNLDTVCPPEPPEPGDGGRTRGQKRKVDDDHSEEEGEGHEDFDPQQLREHEEFTKVKNIEKIELGRFEMETWYYSPFPPEYRDCKKLYFCEYDLQFFKHRHQMLRHLRKVKLLHPPGTEIYRNGNISMFEVDGRKAKTYCQNLCYLAKLFLDHKTLYYDVDPFLFYVLCEKDAQGYHIVGYFSKEKNSAEGNNLACILTLPAYQRKGYGRFLIAFSYELSKKEGRVGSPERPLSDLGAVSYRSYWTREILEVLREHKASLSIKDISERTAIRTDDVVKTLESLSLIKYWKGDHIISVTQKIVEEHLKTIANQRNIEIDLNRLHWTPYRQEPPAKK